MPTRNTRRLENAGRTDDYYAGSLPAVVVTGQRRAPYRSYYQEANDRFLSGIGNAVKSAVRRTADGFGNLAWNVAKTMISLQDDKTSDSYKDATVPYGQGAGHERDNIIQVKNGVAGQMDRLGMYGAVKGKDGVYRFRNPNYIAGDKELQEVKSAFGLEEASDNEFLKWCAENANMLNSALGKPTAGDAWTRHGIYGDSLILQSPAKKSDYIIAKNLASDQGQYVADNIDKHDLKTGDIVDMYYRGSNHFDRAFREGDENRTNSHTGTILKTGPDKEHTYVVHSTGNGLNVQPIGELIGSGFFKKSYITGIRRPGSKNHKYK